MIKKSDISSLMRYTGVFVGALLIKQTAQNPEIMEAVTGVLAIVGNVIWSYVERNQKNDKKNN